LLRRVRRRFVEIYGERLTRLVLFGSEARGDAQSGSDIDLLVVLQGQVNPAAEVARTGGMVAALSLEYDVVLSCTFVSAERYSTEQSPLLMNARREGVAV